MIPALALMLLLQASPATQKAPDLTVTPCDITSLAGDCGYLFPAPPEIPLAKSQFFLNTFAPRPANFKKISVECQPRHEPILTNDGIGFCDPNETPADQPLAKSMADQGWSCTYDEIRIECVAPPKRKTAK